MLGGQLSRAGFFRPYGAGRFLRHRVPGLAPWAIFFPPSGRAVAIPPVVRSQVPKAGPGAPGDELRLYAKDKAKNMANTMDELMLEAPAILAELMREFVRRGDEEYRKDPKSQISACFSLAIRSCSLLSGALMVLKPQTRDSLEVLTRSFLESRDLLMTFRFGHKGTRDKIAYWLAGKVDNSWKADHKKCEEFLAKLGHADSEFAKRWSMITTLAHPTCYAAQNSVSCATLWAADPPRSEGYETMMEPKVADFLTSIATLIVIATYDFPELISLGCDLNRMPEIDQFRGDVFRVAVPILNKNHHGDLPPNSYRA